MTLTTEQLRARAKFWREKAIEAKWESVRIAQDMLQNADAFDELAANREAQPVAEVLSSRAGNDTSTIDKALQDGTKLYTAPPAPAVPPEATPENIENLLADITLFFTAGSLAHGGAVMFAEVWNACRAAMLAQPVSSGYKFNSPVIPDGWIACSERMPELDKRVLLYFGSYSGHIEDGCIGDDGDGPYHYFFDGDSLQQEPTHWMPLPAAPEGGNG
ncbi:Protein of uncharacterised function (DUF551) [Klebsiella oxytoca]|nr:Protein of uncharacterised function (DUF551) [Klebsiella oxytoca]